MSNVADFENPAAIADELTAAADAAATPKPKKASKPKVIHVSYVADKDYKAGDTIEFDYEVPRSSRRGAVAGKALAEMSEDELRIEYRNANSVYYKTNKAGRDASKALERLEACKAEMEKRGMQPGSRVRTAAPMTAESVAAAIASGKISVEDIQKLLDEAEQQ